MTVWQPIETAPKNGTPVLVYSPGNQYGFNTNARRSRIIVDKYMFSDGFCFYREYPEAPYTHWMPLPAPPEEQS
jgi:hypothetical protein